MKRSSEWKAGGRSARAGFTLIELLTVIAIIAILAAIIFPVMSNVRVRAQQTQVVSNLQSIQSAMGLFKSDNHNYPTALGELRISGQGGTNIPRDVLYPEWLKDKSAFLSPNNDVPNPNDFIKVNESVSAGRGYISAALPPGAIDEARNGSLPAYDDMDGHIDKNGNYLLHYSRFRTLKTTDCDYKRQLGFRNPPEDTVITWNDSYVNRDDATDVPKSGDYFVLFLNGKVKKFSVKQVQQKLQEKRDGGCADADPGKEELWRLEP
jgi:prepilin-type N-terminal cleavage/methylation domain-containing protein